MHQQAREFVAQHAWAGARVLEIGSRNVNGSVRDLFEGADWWGIDIEAGPGVDEVADAATYKPKKKFDAVVCCEVLEHTPDGEAICATAWAALKAGGLFVVTAATDPRAPHSAVDGAALRPGEFYANVSKDALTEWLRKFSDVRIETRETPGHGGDIYAVAVK